MKNHPFYLILFGLLIIRCEQKQESQAPKSEFYQLKTYLFATGEQQITTDQFLADAFLPAMKRLGYDRIGVFKNTPDEKDSIRKTFLLIPFQSLEDLASLDDRLNRDSAFLVAGSGYLSATYDQAPYARMESAIMTAFEEWPVMKQPKLNSPMAERIYELRSYESPTETYYRNKVEMFNEGGEVALFEQLNFNAVFYGHVLSGSKMPNLIYMTTFENMEDRNAHWKAFGESPEWKALIGNPKYDNNVSRADIWLLYPTEYSDY